MNEYDFFSLVNDLKHSYIFIYILHYIYIIYIMTNNIQIIVLSLPILIASIKNSQHRWGKCM